MKLKILFLGAAKRLSLLESFCLAAEKEKVEVELFSVENRREVPIGKVAHILIGPDFKSLAFKSFLIEMHRIHCFDLIIPNMDSAATSLASIKNELNKVVDSSVVVSSYNLCVTMEDKICADSYFLQRKFCVPSRDTYPAIAKSRYGFGGKDQAVVKSRKCFLDWLDGRPQSLFIVQEFIEGPEYTVDAFVDRGKNILGLLSRQRLRVSEGEVDLSRSEKVEILRVVSERLLTQDEWYGPITIQFIIDKITGSPYLIEVNPRFGGGVTHSLHLGLDMPRWLIREKLGRPNVTFDSWKEGSIMTRCRRDVFYDDIY